MRLKKLIVILAVFSFFLNNSLYSYSSNPKDFIDELVNDAISKLADKSVHKDEKINYIENIALNNVDINALGLYTLGELRKSAQDDKLAKYQTSFKKYFLKSLTSRLTDYSTSNFEIIGSDLKSANYTIVKSKIIPKNGDPEIKIDWRVYTKNPDKPLIRDLIVEGLSLARTQKEEFNSVIQNNNNDINALFKVLEEFIIK